MLDSPLQIDPPIRHTKNKYTDVVVSDTPISEPPAETTNPTSAVIAEIKVRTNKNVPVPLSVCTPLPE